MNFETEKNTNELHNPFNKFGQDNSGGDNKVANNLEETLFGSSQIEPVELGEIVDPTIDNNDQFVTFGSEGDFVESVNSAPDESGKRNISEIFTTSGQNNEDEQKVETSEITPHEPEQEPVQELAQEAAQEPSQEPEQEPKQEFEDEVLKNLIAKAKELPGNSDEEIPTIEPEPEIPIKDSAAEPEIPTIEPESEIIAAENISVETSPVKLRLQKNIKNESAEGAGANPESSVEKIDGLSEDTVKQVMLFVNAKLNLKHPISAEQYKKLGGLEAIANFLSTDEESKEKLVKKIKGLEKKFNLKESFKNTKEFNDRSRRLIAHYNLLTDNNYPITNEAYEELGRSEGILSLITKTEEERTALKASFSTFSRNLTEKEPEIDIDKAGIDDIPRLDQYLEKKSEEADILRNEIEEDESKGNINNFKYVEIHNMDEEIIKIKRKIKELRKAKGVSPEIHDELVGGEIVSEEVEIDLEAEKVAAEKLKAIEAENLEFEKRMNVFNEINCDSIEKFYDGMAKIKIGDNYSFVNESGVVLSEQFDNAAYYNEGMAAVEKNGKSFHIDKEGNRIYKESYGGARQFSEGMAAVKKGEKWIYINEKGEDELGMFFEEAWSFSEGLATVLKDDRFYYLDKSGNLLPPTGYDYASKFTNGIANVRVSGVWFQIDKGFNVMNKEGYKSLSLLDDDGFSFALSDKYFFVDNKGQRISEKFDEVVNLSEGMALVKDNDEYFYYDVEKEQKIEIEKVEGWLNTFEEGKYFSGGLAAVKIDGKWQFIDKEGNLAIKEKYDDVMSFHGSIAEVMKDGVWFLINKNGERVFDKKNNKKSPKGSGKTISPETDGQIKKGSVVHWVKDGIKKYDKPLKIISVIDGLASVEGSDAEIPISELKIAA